MKFKINISKLTCLGLAVLGTTTQVYAAQPGPQSSQVSATIEEATFNATVPTSIPIQIKADGSVVTAESLEITTLNSNLPIELKKVEISPNSDWSLAIYEEGATVKSVDKKELGLKLYKDSSVFKTSGSSSESFNMEGKGWDTSNAESIKFNYAGSSGPTTEDGSIGSKFDVVFTVGWLEYGFEDYYKAEGRRVEGYQIVLQDEFKEALNSNTPYKGWNPGDPIPYIPSMYNGKKVGLLTSMFSGMNNIESVDLSNVDFTNIVDASYMFHNCTNLKEVTFGNTDYTGLDKSLKLVSFIEGCTSIEYVDLSNLNSDNLTIDNMGSQMNCKEGVTIIIDKMSRAVDVGYAFRTVKGVVTLKPESFYTFTSDGGSGYKVSLTEEFKSHIDQASQSEENYKGFIASSDSIPSPPAIYKGKKITSMEGLFSNLNNAQTLNIRNWCDLTNITVDNFFQNSNSLTKCQAGTNTDILNSSIGKPDGLTVSQW